MPTLPFASNAANAYPRTSGGVAAKELQELVQNPRKYKERIMAILAETEKSSANPTALNIVQHMQRTREELNPHIPEKSLPEWAIPALIAAGIVAGSWLKDQWSGWRASRQSPAATSGEEWARQDSQSSNAPHTPNDMELRDLATLVKISLERTYQTSAGYSVTISGYPYGCSNLNCCGSGYEVGLRLNGQLFASYCGSCGMRKR